VILIIGNLNSLGGSLAQHFSSQNIPYAFCAQYTQSTHRIVHTHPLYAITFNEIDPFLADHHNEISSIINLSSLDIPVHTQPDTLIQAVFRSSQKLWVWCAKMQKEYIYASSQHTYDGLHHAHYSDGLKTPDMLQPQSLLGWAHNMMDRWMAHMTLHADSKPPRTIAFKPFNLFTLSHQQPDNSSIIDAMLVSLRNSKPVPLYLSQSPDFEDGGYIRHFLHVDDCAHLLASIISSPHIHDTIINIAHPESLTLKNAALTIARTLQVEPSFSFISPTPNAGLLHPIERPNLSQISALQLPHKLPSFQERVSSAISG